MDVNDVFEANLETLQKVYQQIKIYKLNKHVIYGDIINFFCTSSEIQMNDKDVIKAFGMCKMTVVDETDDGEKKYDRLYFVEFLEFLGRLAHAKFEQSEMEGLPLAEKITILLEELFEYTGDKFKKIKTEILDETESDSDY